MTPRQSLRSLLLWSCIAAALVAAPIGRPLHADDAARPLADRAAAAEVTGRLETLDGARVLTLWGTAHERGFSHGYLLAPDIVALLDGYLAETITDVGVFEQRAAAFVRMFSLLPRYQEELRGMLAGIERRLGKDARVPALDRPLTYDDLLSVVCIPELSRLACSSFAAWGSLTPSGETICGRNLDWRNIDALHGTELVIVHLPDESARTRGWVSVTWPGFAGAITGMNDAGVCGSLHDVRAPRPTMPLGFTPRAMALREALEAAPADAALDKFTSVFKKRLALVGNNIPVAWPHVPGAAPPFAVLEYDGQLANERGVTVRQSEPRPMMAGDTGKPAKFTKSAAPPRPAPSPAPSGEPAEFLLCTNHHCLRAEPRRCDRYETLRDRLGGIAGRGEKVDLPAAWSLLQSVACDGEPLETHHSVVFEPNRRRLNVAYATGGKPAPACKPVVLDVDRLMAAPGPLANTAKSP